MESIDEEVLDCSVVVCNWYVGFRTVEGVHVCVQPCSVIEYYHCHALSHDITIVSCTMIFMELADL